MEEELQGDKPLLPRNNNKGDSGNTMLSLSSRVARIGTHLCADPSPHGHQ